VQENGFKHGKERWGINQLDRRKRLQYAPGTLIPNPGRRRLDFSIRVSREKEGVLRNKLARLEEGTLKHVEVKAQLDEQLLIQAKLLAQRPSLPSHAPVEETELADELTYHDPQYKVVLDVNSVLRSVSRSNGQKDERQARPVHHLWLLQGPSSRPQAAAVHHNNKS
jgi:hypothetical protein